MDEGGKCLPQSAQLPCVEASPVHNNLDGKRSHDAINDIFLALDVTCTHRHTPAWIRPSSTAAQPLA